MTQATLDYVAGKPEVDNVQPTTKDENKTTGTEIVDLTKYNIATLFTKGGSEPFLDEIEKQAESIVIDITTPKGRKEIASMAYKIAQSKTTLDKAGKELKDEEQKKVNAIDAERKNIRDRLDALKEKVRAPLTEFEKLEESRVKAHKERIDAMRVAPHYEEELTSDEIQRKITDLENTHESNSDGSPYIWQEFGDMAKAVFESSHKQLSTKFEQRAKHEKDRAELEKLRQEKEQKEREEREEALKQEAADRARKEAEEKAEREKLEAETKAKAEQDRLQREKQEAEAKAKAEKERFEREAKEREERAEREKQEAIEAERKRAEDEKAKVEAERKKREADDKNKQRVYLDIHSAIVEATGDGGKESHQIAKAIVEGRIPHVTISY